MDVNTSLYAAFVVAAIVLILIPGPTVMFVTSVSLRDGGRAGLIAVAGSTAAAAIQLLVVVAGLASAVVLVGHWFEWIRWAGVAYLVYLGIRAWLKRPSDDRREPRAIPARTVLRLFAQGFVVTLTNPKTLLFHGAFLPQFVDPALPALPQLAVLAVTFVIVAGLLDSAWALLASRVRVVLSSAPVKRLADRVAGTLLLGAAVALAAVRRSESA